MVDDAALAERLGVSPSTYQHARKQGASHAEISEAKRRGIDLEAYAEARWAGASHAAVLEAHDQGLDVGGWALLLDRDEDEPDRLAAASEAGVDLVAYTRLVFELRSAPWWPDWVDLPGEILDAHQRGIDLDQYGWTRMDGVLHGDVVGASDRGIDLVRFASLVAKGHPDTAIPMTDLPRRLLEAHDRGEDLDAFALGWRSKHFPSYSIPVPEIREALDRGARSERYVPIRVLGVAHVDALGAIDRGIDLMRFASLIRTGHPDKTVPMSGLPRELLEAHDRGEDLDAFARGWRSAYFPDSS